MALTPQNNEAFLREVDEELRRDRAVEIWRRWGRAGIAAIVIGLLAFGGYLWWRNNQEAKAGNEGVAVVGALNDLSASKPADAEAKLKPLESAQSPGYRVAAKLLRADIVLDRGDAKGAVALFAQVASDASAAKPYRDAALIRQTAIEYDQLKPEQVVARLKPLAVSGNAWFGSAGEMTGIAYMRMNKPDLAGAMFGAIARDTQVPETIRSRSVQLASLLGVEVAPVGAQNRN